MLALQLLVSLLATAVVGALAAAIQNKVEGEDPIRCAWGGMAAGIATGICTLLFQQFGVALI